MRRSKIWPKPGCGITARPSEVNGESPEEGEGGIAVPTAALFYGLMATVAAAIWYAIHGTLPFRVGDAAQPLAVCVGLGAGVGLAVVALSRVLDRSFAWSRRLSGLLGEMLGGMTPAKAAVLALSSAIGEEVLFRGVLLPTIGVVASSLVFGMLHVGPTREYLPWTVMAVIMGFGFAGLTVWTGNIAAAVIAHLTINYFNILALPSPGRV